MIDSPLLFVCPDPPHRFIDLPTLGACKRLTYIRPAAPRPAPHALCQWESVDREESRMYIYYSWAWSVKREADVGELVFTTTVHGVTCIRTYISALYDKKMGVDRDETLHGS